MQARGRKGKMAKRRGYEQNLIEVDVPPEIQPILTEVRHYGLLSPTKKKILRFAGEATGQSEVR